MEIVSVEVCKWLIYLQHLPPLRTEAWSYRSKQAMQSQRHCMMEKLKGLSTPRTPSNLICLVWVGISRGIR